MVCCLQSGVSNPFQFVVACLADLLWLPLACVTTAQRSACCPLACVAARPCIAAAPCARNAVLAIKHLLRALESTFVCLSSSVRRTRMRKLCVTPTLRIQSKQHSLTAQLKEDQVSHNRRLGSLLVPPPVGDQVSAAPGHNPPSATVPAVPWRCGPWSVLGNHPALRGAWEPLSSVLPTTAS